jgi:ceramide glucosyltransferase
MLMAVYLTARGKMFTDMLQIGIIVGLVYTAFLTINTFYEMRKRSRRLPDHQLPPVSILKPLKGIDDQLEQNLRSFFKIDYPRYELLFGVNDFNDPAITVVKKLQKKYPSVDSKLIVDSSRVGLNPKVNNLNNLYPQSAHHCLLISDSNVRVSPGYLKEIMSEYLSPNVGLVTSIFRGSGGRSLGSHLENLHLNTYIAPNVFAVKRLTGKSITIGKSMLFNRSLIKRIKGFSALGEFLAEDHLLGVHAKRAGLEIRISNHVIDNINISWSVERFLNRHLRWAKMRKNINIFHYLAEPLSNPIMLALIALLGGFDQNSLYLFLCVAILKVSLDRITAVFIGADSKWRHYLLIPLKDVLIGLVWLIPFVDQKIFWRGNWFKITKGTRLQPITG